MASETDQPNLLDLFKNMLDDHLGKAEFLKAFQQVIDHVKEADTKTTGAVQTIATTLQAKHDELRGETTTGFEAHKSEAVSLLKINLQQYAQAIDAKLSEVDAKLATVTSGIDGLNPDPAVVVAEVLAKIPGYREFINDTPEDIRNKLELLQEDERLDASAIKGLDERFKKSEKDNASFFGGGMSMPLADGTYVKYHGGASNITLSVTQPVNPIAGDLWLDIS